MINLIEVDSYSKKNEEQWHNLWNKKDINQILLQPISINSKTPNLFYNAIPIYFIMPKSSKNEFIKTIESYFRIPKIILKSKIFYKIGLITFPIINSLILKKEIKKIEKKQLINVILLHYSYGTHMPFFHNKTKTFFYIHCILKKTGMYQSSIKKIIAKVSFFKKKIICCSKTSYNDFLDTNIPTLYCNYVLNGIPIKNVQKLSNVELPKKYQNMDYIVFVGRLSEEKQIPKIIQAYIKSKIPAKLVIIGYSPNDNSNEIKNIKTTIKKFKCKKDIILYGKDNNPYRWFKNAKFSVIFSKHEGAGRTIPESLACKTPVVMGNQGGCKEYYKDYPELQKYIIDYTNVDGLAQAMQKMYNNPIKINNELANKYTYEKHIDNLIKIFKQNKLI